MNFKLGNRVRHSFRSTEATIIAFDKRVPDYALLGWKEGEEVYIGAWPLEREMDGIRRVCKVIDDIVEYKFGFWCTQSSLELIAVRLGTFSRINQNTLRKRMRDQIAQEIFKG